MAPRRRSNTGFIGVRLRPAGHFAAEITAGGTRVWLGTFYTKEAAARAYDVAAWRFGRSRHEMNFPEVRSLTEAQSLSTEPLLRSQGEARRYRSGQRRIDTTEADEQFMAQWRRDHPGAVEAERAFWKEKQTYRRERRAGKRQRRAEYEAEYAKGEASTWGEDDERWLWNLSSTASEDTPSEDEDFDF
ncbi:hypothetical protein QYE76_034986 [Lolium multiflorum]|uniref:AP2/ERF domain-containing protein n=1 Tax=Lolium multiflorum TaxID=4521 RepID=A0AAD8VNS9_LOLMU|nr:hypothetical protein QYE76_034986 [Lolium multiflorum]